MSKHGSHERRKPRDWDELWSVVWLNLFHGLGIIFVLGLVALIGGCIIEDIFGRSRRQSSEVISKTPATGADPLPERNREAIQANFNKVLFATPKPCAVKSKGISNFSDCTLFGIRLGMGLDDVKKTIDGSGYFVRGTYFREGGCGTKNCAGSIYQSREGLSVSVALDRTFPEDKTLLAARQVTLTLSIGGNPYFDPDSLRGTFVKLFGPPDGNASPPPIAIACILKGRML